MSHRPDIERRLVHEGFRSAGYVREGEVFRHPDAPDVPVVVGWGGAVFDNPEGERLTRARLWNLRDYEHADFAKVGSERTGRTVWIRPLHWEGGSMVWGQASPDEERGWYFDVEDLVVLEVRALRAAENEGLAHLAERGFLNPPGWAVYRRERPGERWYPVALEFEEHMARVRAKAIREMAHEKGRTEVETTVREVREGVAPFYLSAAVPALVNPRGTRVFYATQVAGDAEEFFKMKREAESWLWRQLDEAEEEGGIPGYEVAWLHRVVVDREGCVRQRRRLLVVRRQPPEVLYPDTREEELTPEPDECHLQLAEVGM